MDDYDNIPLQGKHQGDAPHETGMNVRAQQPPDPESPSSETIKRTYQLLKSDLEGQYHVRAWTPGQEATAPEEYEELGHYESDTALEKALDELPEAPRFIVLENSETGDARLAHLEDLSDNWAAGENYDQFMLFADEDEASRYVDERRSSE